MVRGRGRGRGSLGIRYMVMVVLLLLLDGPGPIIGSAKRQQSKRHGKRHRNSARASLGVSLVHRIDVIQAGLQAGQIALEEGVTELVKLDDEAKQPADVATLNAMLGELYRHIARQQQSSAARRRTEHSAVGRFLRAADAWGRDSALGVDSLRLAAATARDLSGGCSSELEFAVSVQEQYATAVGTRSEAGRMAWTQLAEYQYYRQDHEAVLRSLSAIEDDVDSEALGDENVRIFALLLTGFALKQLERYEEAVESLQEILTRLAPAQVDRRTQTTVHLGEALQRMGRRDEAQVLWERGVAAGWFPSAYQRPSQVHARSLPSRPIWDVRDSSLNHVGALREIVEELETTSVWMSIRAESRAAIAAGHFTVDPGSVTRYTGGPWYHLVLYEYGLKDFKNCMLVPKTCAAIESLASGAVARNSHGQVKLSLMSPGIHVLPHCGPTNTRIRMHLGLCIPSGANLRFVVGGENASWTEGKVTVFDDSYEHEIVFPNSEGSFALGNKQVREQGRQAQGQAQEQPMPSSMDLIDTGRLVLLFDTWHPSLTRAEIAAVRATNLFDL